MGRGTVSQIIKVHVYKPESVNLLMKIDKAHGQQIQMDCSCVRKMLQFDLPGQ